MTFREELLQIAKKANTEKENAQKKEAINSYLKERCMYAATNGTYSVSIFLGFYRIPSSNIEFLLTEENVKQFAFENDLYYTPSSNTSNAMPMISFQ